MDRKRVPFGLFGCNCGEEDCEEELFECPEIELPEADDFGGASRFDRGKEGGGRNFVLDLGEQDGFSADPVFKGFAGGALGQSSSRRDDRRLARNSANPLVGSALLATAEESNPPNPIPEQGKTSNGFGFGGVVGTPGASVVLSEEPSGPIFRNVKTQEKEKEVLSESAKDKTELSVDVGDSPESSSAVLSGEGKRDTKVASSSSSTAESDETIDRGTAEKTATSAASTSSSSSSTSSSEKAEVNMGSTETAEETQARSAADRTAVPSKDSLGSTPPSAREGIPTGDADRSILSSSPPESPEAAPSPLASSLLSPKGESLNTWVAEHLSDDDYMISPRTAKNLQNNAKVRHLSKNRPASAEGLSSFGASSSTSLRREETSNKAGLQQEASTQDESVALSSVSAGAASPVGAYKLANGGPALPALALGATAVSKLPLAINTGYATPAFEAEPNGSPTPGSPTFGRPGYSKSSASSTTISTSQASPPPGSAEKQMRHLTGSLPDGTVLTSSRQGRDRLPRTGISGKVFVRRRNYFHQEDNLYVAEYLENCRKYNIRIDPGVVSCLQTDGQDLYIQCEGLLTVASILCNPVNPPVTRLHVMPRYENRSNQYICLILEQILHANRTLEVVDLCDIGINPDGMQYLVAGLHQHASVRQLLLSRNDLGSKGCKLVIKGCATMPVIEKVDVTFCGIGATYTHILTQLGKKHPKKPEVRTEGNTATEEIWSAITHGLGLLWSIIAGIYMTIHVRDNPTHHVLGCLTYSVCKFLLFLFSTLYHSFFLKVSTHQVFQILDHCGIFLFIAASYTPVIQLSEMSKEAATTILVAQWILAVVGVVAFIMAYYYEGFKRWYGLIEPFICIAMGWMISLRYEETVGSMPADSANLLLVGGILYTFGVVFLLADRHFPFLHVIWHLFVLAASVCHWFSILHYAEFSKQRWEILHGKSREWEAGLLIQHYSQHFDMLKESISVLVAGVATGTVTAALPGISNTVGGYVNSRSAAPGTLNDPLSSKGRVNADPLKQGASSAKTVTDDYESEDEAPRSSNRDFEL
ncbi:unnamed protein product [Amoebophrya sp. A25]|nr:unnamed protein product [Amoebophrya sp. A25]|eukprot:GSA25T00005683001.1